MKEGWRDGSSESAAEWRVESQKPQVGVESPYNGNSSNDRWRTSDVALIPAVTPINNDQTITFYAEEKGVRRGGGRVVACELLISRPAGNRQALK